MARAWVRLRLLKWMAEAGQVALIFQDESEALTHPYLARSWAPRGADLRVEAPGQSKKVPLIGGLDAATGRALIVATETKRSTDFIAWLELLDKEYGPSATTPRPPVVLVLDNGPIHTSKLSRAALADRSAWLTVEWLPKYAPELNDIERFWRKLKVSHLANRRWRDVAHLKSAIESAVDELNAKAESTRCLRLAA